jgi:hypothetical protein
MSFQLPPPKKSNTGLWLGGAAILLVALIAVLVLLLNRQPAPAAPAAAVIVSADPATPEPATAMPAIADTPTPAPTEIPTSTPMPELGTSNLFIEYILDASGSMSETLPDGTLKIDAAQQVLTEHMRSFRPETNIGLRVYGHRLPYQQTDESCRDIELIAPPEKGQMERIVSWLQDFTVQGMTPLAASLELAKEDFVYDASHINSIVMLSDGIETCGGDPCQLVEDLKAEGINFTIHVIGLDVDDPTRQQLTCIAEAGDGTYHDARSQQELDAALGAVQEDVTQDEIIVPPGMSTPTPAPTSTPAQTPTSIPTRPVALSPGTFSLVGYYLSVEQEAWGETAVCDRLVVIDGSQDLIQEFLDLIDSGNSINSKNSLNQPEVNIDLSVVSPRDVEAIKASTVDQPIQLIVSKPPPGGYGAPVCSSLIEINDVVAIDGRTVAPPPPADGIAGGLAPGQILLFSNRDYDNVDIKRGQPLDSTRHELYVMDADGSNQRRLRNDIGLSGLYDQALSADRSTLLIVHGNRLSRVDVADPGLTAIGGPGVFLSVSWSPDDSQIAYTKFNSAQLAEQVWVMNADGTGSRQLTSDNKRTLFVDWSPDGNKLALSYDYQLHLMDPGGSTPQLIYSGFTRNLAWSPDGSMISFEGLNTPNDYYDDMDIWIIGSDGSNPRNLTNTVKVYDGNPSWSPDGKYIVFASFDAHDPYSRSQLIKIDVATDEITQLTTQGNNVVPLWVK